MYVCYPQSSSISWRVGRKAARVLYDKHNATRVEDRMEGGMVGSGKHIARLGGAVVDYAIASALSLAAQRLPRARVHLRRYRNDLRQPGFEQREEPRPMQPHRRCRLALPLELLP